MRCDGELELLTRFIRGVVTGPRAKLDGIDEKSVESLRREPLHAWLLRVARAGCKVRGTRGNSVREVLDLLAQVMNQMGLSKQELARRSGVSRGHLTELFGANESRPMMETIVRIAVGLNFPIEVVSDGDEHLDDAPAAETTSPSEPPTAEAEPGWRNAGAFGLVGAGVVGLGFTLKHPAARHAAFFIGAGIVAGTLVAGLTRVLAARSANDQNRGAHGR